MNRRLFVLFLTFTLLLIGCGSNEPEPAEPPDSPAASEATAAEDVVEEEADVAEETTAEGEVALTAASDNLHIPSPAWEDQIIYFVMTDRFNDGDPSNNDQGMGEYDPADERKYQGGDFAGIVEELDYIQGLGATAIWITPPVANQWWDPIVNFGGYHGYWAENFKEVDAHLGTLEDYKDLSRALHSNDMYLIQDIVVNHTGNFFSYDGAFDPLNAEEKFFLNTESIPVTAPTQFPFNQNDINNPDHVEADIYHWTPTISDFNNASQRQLYQLADLDDLDTKNRVVRDALRGSFGYWIEEVGVDGFRIDTIIYVEDDFWADFHYRQDEDAPGVDLVAAKTGRDDFFSFGEAFLGSQPLDDSADLLLNSYLNVDDKPGMDAVLNFPLQSDMNLVFAGGQPTNFLNFRVEKALELYPNPYIVPNFIDNHDMARFLASGSPAALKQASVFLMTVPGIPVIYYGTEQGFTEQRASMFAEGWGSEGEDHFNTESELYQHFARLGEIRHDNALFRRGSYEPLMDTANGPGVLAYKRSYEGQEALVIFNTADRTVLMGELNTGLPAGTVLTNIYGLVDTDDVVVGRDGLITRELAPREGMILLVGEETVPVDVAEAMLTVDASIAGELLTADATLSGSFSIANTSLRVIIDGDVDNSIDVMTDGDGQWEVTIPLNRFPPGVTEHTLQLYAPEVSFVAAPVAFATETASFDVQVMVEDLAGDDKGPDGTYSLPTDSSFGSQMDIRALALEAPGPDLQVTLTMEQITDVWGPINGFDHTVLHVYIDLPGREGTNVLPRINATAPDGFAWDYMAFLEGWNNRLYSAAGASATEYGASTAPAPVINTDIEAGTITITFSGMAMGNPTSYDGTQVYVTTWDWNGPDGVYRSLEAEASDWIFGGGNSSMPLIADTVGPLTLADEG